MTIHVWRSWCEARITIPCIGAYLFFPLAHCTPCIWLCWPMLPFLGTSTHKIYPSSSWAIQHCGDSVDGCHIDPCTHAVGGEFHHLLDGKPQVALFGPANVPLNQAADRQWTLDLRCWCSRAGWAPMVQGFVFAAEDKTFPKVGEGFWDAMIGLWTFSAKMFRGLYLVSFKKSTFIIMTLSVGVDFKAIYVQNGCFFLKPLPSIKRWLFRERGSENPNSNDCLNKFELFGELWISSTEQELPPQTTSTSLRQGDLRGPPQCHLPKKWGLIKPSSPNKALALGGHPWISMIKATLFSLASSEINLIFSQQPSWANTPRQCHPIPDPIILLRLYFEGLRSPSLSHSHFAGNKTFLTARWAPNQLYVGAHNSTYRGCNPTYPFRRPFTRPELLFFLVGPPCTHYTSTGGLDSGGCETTAIMPFIGATRWASVVIGRL